MGINKNYDFIFDGVFLDEMSYSSNYVVVKFAVHNKLVII